MRPKRKSAGAPTPAKNLSKADKTITENTPPVNERPRVAKLAPPEAQVTFEQWRGS